MNIYLSHMSALLFWRWWSQTHPVTLRDFHDSGKQSGLALPSSMLPTSAMLKSCAATKTDAARVISPLQGDTSVTNRIIELVGNEGQSPIELLVSPKPGVRSTKGFRFHQCGLALPRQAFLKVAPGIWVSSPEFVFMQLATRLSFGELIALGYELCGCYPIGKTSGALVRRPLSTPERLAAFTDQVKNAKAAKVARSAAKQVKRKSASMMETEVASFALTSKRRGGLGLSDAQLNTALTLSGRGARIAGQQRIVCDMYWPESRVAVEYDGRDSHGSATTQARDSRRRDALAAMNIDVTTITFPQLSNVREFEALMRHVSRKTGKPLRKMTPAQLRNHMELRRQVREFHRKYFPHDL